MDRNRHGGKYDHASRAYEGASSGGGGSGKSRGPPYGTEKFGGARRREARGPVRSRNVTDLDSDDGKFGCLGVNHGNFHATVNAFPKEV